MATCYYYIETVTKNIIVHKEFWADLYQNNENNNYEI